MVLHIYDNKKTPELFIYACFVAFVLRLAAKAGIWERQRQQLSLTNNQSPFRSPELWHYEPVSKTMHFMKV